MRKFWLEIWAFCWKSICLKKGYLKMAYFEQHSSTLTFILIWKEESFWNFSLSYGTKIRFFTIWGNTHTYIVPTQTWKVCYWPFLETTSGILWSIGILWSASITKRGDGSECSKVFFQCMGMCGKQGGLTVLWGDQGIRNTKRRLFTNEDGTGK